MGDSPSLAGTGTAYQEHLPPGSLRGHFGQLWQSQLPADADGHITVLPDGCVDILWRDGALFVVGPDRVAAHPALAPGAQVLGARFRPGQALAALGLPLAGIIGQAVPLADLKGTWVNKAAASIGDTAPALRLQRMAHCLQQHMGASALDTSAQRAHVLFRALAAGDATLDTLAAHLSLSPRSLRRFSQSQFGYGAKTLERILRLQRFLRQSRALPQHSLAMLAADAGYADQAHLSREARELAGMTASELRLEWGQ
ncbi:helix-turn-helix transcriptional regulator [Stenotrophomonas pavanii]|uniref:helix-turn-helix transcriptional regulator n=1 Tax=Stenotrophomonas pavanii TaxID=487698 RepID=UPI00088473FA|nr:helix-turn-helix domain-containing protein [Stenotrophomonas pavanii]MBN7836267.1 helix-turn-helix domain-containing protein [Stenotrophomonas maltophilia]SDK37544.1 AraC-type DNA-binding protein [Stenotrophomonas pavanii]